jgi:hypothetical protein
LCRNQYTNLEEPDSINNLFNVNINETELCHLKAMLHRTKFFLEFKNQNSRLLIKENEDALLSAMNYLMKMTQSLFESNKTFDEALIGFRTF